MENKKVVTLLNIASVTNFIFASFFFLNFFDGYSLYGIISIASLVLAGMYYQNLTKESLDEIKEQKRKLIWEATKRKELLNANIDYNFLQSLIDKINNNPDLIIEINFRSGDRMTIRQKQELNHNDLFNGLPNVEEIG